MRSNDSVRSVTSLCHGKEGATYGTRKGAEWARLMEPLGQTVLVLRFSWLSLLLCCAPISFGQTPQEQAWSILQGGFGDESASTRRQAVRALALLPGNQKAVAASETALEDEKPQVRAAAATTLGQMCSTGSIPKLRKALSDDDASVVLAAAHALRTLKDPVAYKVFYEVLTGERKSAEGIVGQGMETLKDGKKAAKLGFEEGIGFVPFADIGYSAVKAVTKDDASPVRAAAANILANDPDPRSGQALVQAASDKKWIVRVAALEAIAKRGDPKLQSGIVSAMSDQNEAVRMTAAAAVFKLSAIAKPSGAAKSSSSRRKSSNAHARDKSMTGKSAILDSRI